MDFSFIADEELRVKAQEEYTKSVAGITAEVDSKVEAAVLGLKAKNDELLAEKKAIQERLKEFGDNIDPKAAKEAIEFLQKSTEAQMIKDGRIDELIQMKTAQFRADTEAKLKELQGAVQEKEGEAVVFRSKFEQKMVEDHLREIALRAGVIPSAVNDVLLRGGMVFSYSPSGEVEARDKDGKLRNTKDGKILTSENWIAELKETSPHYWPPSKGGGFFGPGGGDEADIQARLADLAAKGDVKGYRELRAKMGKKKAA